MLLSKVHQQQQIATTECPAFAVSGC